MSDLFFRTEDIKPDEVLDYFVESKRDREIIDWLKNRNPTIVIGSRGVGKSFLLRIAQQEMLRDFGKTRNFPVYISFIRSSLLHSQDIHQFKNWMLARISTSIFRSLVKEGLLAKMPASTRHLTGGHTLGQNGTPELTPLERVINTYEESWKNPEQVINTKIIPSVDDLKSTVEEICDALDIGRISLLIDEAAHIFVPEQQRQFFTLFRDLRSYCITCNAAVYPGVTSYGPTFQPAHDATMVSIERDVLASDYVGNMKEIVEKQEKQKDSTLMRNINQNMQNFSILSYAASGNPRLLLKTLSKCPKVNSREINETIREYYRTDIWSEHSGLSKRYSGHSDIIDWGRDFVENIILPEIQQKNSNYLKAEQKTIKAEQKTSAYFWISKDAPAIVMEALRILSYTGILSEQGSGIKSSGSKIGTRYSVNLGCLFSLESVPTATAFEIATKLTPKRMTEFGPDRTNYTALTDKVKNIPSEEKGIALEEQLSKSIEVLDVTEWQRQKLIELNLNTVGEVLGATEEKLQEALYVGGVRARRMKNAAVAAVLEYLSG